MSDKQFFLIFWDLFSGISIEDLSDVISDSIESNHAPIKTKKPQQIPELKLLATSHKINIDCE